MIEWLSDEDHRLRAALDTVNLVVEMNLTADEIRRVQSRYGLAVEAYLKKGHGFATIANRYPALTLAALVGQAALGYDRAPTGGNSGMNWGCRKIRIVRPSFGIRLIRF
jgi:hypothetical protein